MIAFEIPVSSSNGEEDEAVQRAWSLASNHAASDAGLDSVAKPTTIIGAADVQLAELVAAVRHWVTAYSDTRTGKTTTMHCSGFMACKGEVRSSS